MPNTHIVLRPFQAGTTAVEIGQAVDASSWKNVERLVNTRYLRPMSAVDYAQNTSKSKSTPPSAAPKRFKIKKG